MHAIQTDQHATTLAQALKKQTGRPASRLAGWQAGQNGMGGRENKRAEQTEKQADVRKQ